MSENRFRKYDEFVDEKKVLDAYTNEVNFRLQQI